MAEPLASGLWAGVLVPAPQATEIGGILLQVMREAPAEYSPELWELALCFDRVGRRKSAGVARTSAEGLQSRNVETWMKISQAALVLRCSRSAISKRLRKGTLDGEQDDAGVWWISEAVVDRDLERRSA